MKTIISTHKLREVATSKYLYPITQFIKRSPVLSKWFRSTIRTYQDLSGTAPNILRELRDIEPAPAPNSPKQKVLIFTLRGWLTHLAWETTIARALHLHGAQTLTILCDKLLSACEPRTIVDDFESTCNLCRTRSQTFLTRNQLPYSDLSNYLDRKSIIPLLQSTDNLSLSELQSFTHNELPIGELVGASVQRHLLEGDIDDTPENIAIYRRFVHAGLMIQQIAHIMLDEYQPDTILLLNGLFYAEAIMMAIAKARGIPVWTYERANKRVDALIFAQDRPVVKHTFEDEWATRAEKPLTETENEQLNRYLSQRRSGKTGIENLWEKMEKVEGQNDQRPLAILFTNVLWDTAVYKADIAFTSMIHWVKHTIDWFRQNPQYRLIIRIHPAEVRIPFKESRSPVGQYLTELPENVQVFDSTDTVDSYAMLDSAQLALVYTSTIGLEAVLSGKYTLVAGQTHYNHKGFTADPDTLATYDRVLAEGLQNPPEIATQITLARRYAYMYFFEEMIPFPFVREKPMSYPSLTYQDNEPLSPGASPYIEAICDAILHNKPPKNPTPQQM